MTLTNDDNINGNIFNAHYLCQYINNKETCGYRVDIFKSYSTLCHKGNLDLLNINLNKYTLYIE